MRNEKANIRIGNAIRLARLRKRIPQKILANEIKAKQQELWAWEHGIKQIGGIKLLLIIEVLGEGFWQEWKIEKMKPAPVAEAAVVED